MFATKFVTRLRRFQFASGLSAKNIREEVDVTRIWRQSFSEAMFSPSHVYKKKKEKKMRKTVTFLRD